MTDKPAKRAPRAPKPKDIAILHGPTEDGEGARLLRLKGGEVWSGEVRPVREGQPIEQHELVRLHPLHPGLPVCEIEVLHAPKATKSTPEQRESSGPARVSNPRYRQNWNTIFGNPSRKGKTSWSVN
ncbi:MAG TPA: hypothetical protein VK509_17275 [Polyangiales bacterium]|nr:hypothetical protein [Polyangiales bacterium]